MDKKNKRELKNGIQREIINLVVYDDEDFLSPYSGDDQEIISQEVAGFLNSRAKRLKRHKQVHIKISSNKIEESEQKVYSRAIQNYYSNEKSEIERKQNFYLLIGSILTLAAIAIFTILYLLIIKLNLPILNEIITVIGWVFLWEAVDLFCIRTPLLQSQRRICQNLISAKITYHGLEPKARTKNIKILSN